MSEIKIMQRCTKCTRGIRNQTHVTDKQHAKDLSAQRATSLWDLGTGIVDRAAQCNGFVFLHLVSLFLSSSRIYSGAERLTRWHCDLSQLAGECNNFASGPALPVATHGGNLRLLSHCIRGSKSQRLEIYFCSPLCSLHWLLSHLEQHSRLYFSPVSFVFALESPPWGLGSSTNCPWVRSWFSAPLLVLLPVWESGPRDNAWRIH